MVVFENEPKATRVSVKRIALTLAIAGAIVVGVAGVAVASDHVAGRGDQRDGSLAEGLYRLEHRSPTTIDCGVIERTDEAPTADIVSFAIHPRMFRYPEGWLVPGGYPESERYYSDVSLH